MENILYTICIVAVVVCLTAIAVSKFERDNKEYNIFMDSLSKASGINRQELKKYSGKRIKELATQYHIEY